MISTWLAEAAKEDTPTAKLKDMLLKPYLNFWDKFSKESFDWLYLKVEKRTFECTTVEYLGLVLSEGHVEMNPVKITRVRDWLTLKNVTKVQSFMSFMNFYYRFIPEFSHIASPLHHLTKKAEPWCWTKPKETAFWVLKSLVIWPRSSYSQTRMHTFDLKPMPLDM